MKTFQVFFFQEKGNSRAWMLKIKKKKLFIHIAFWLRADNDLNKQRCPRRNNQYQVLKFIVRTVWGHGEIFCIAALRKQTQQDQMYTRHKKTTKKTTMNLESTQR